jgi:uncharacterized membrane protein YfcA
MMEFHAKLALLGLVAGATTASTGIGWGLITVPVLLLVLQVQPREAVGLSVLASIGCLVSLAAYRYTYGGVAWGAMLALTLGSLVGGLVGVATVDFIPALTVKRIIGVMTIIAGLALLIPWKD